MTEFKEKETNRDASTHRLWLSKMLKSQKQGLEKWSEHGSSEIYKYYKAVSDFIETVLEPYLDSKINEEIAGGQLKNFLSSVDSFGLEEAREIKNLEIACKVLWAFRSVETKKVLDDEFDEMKNEIEKLVVRLQSLGIDITRDNDDYERYKRLNFKLRYLKTGDNGSWLEPDKRTMKAYQAIHNLKRGLEELLKDTVLGE